MIRRRMVGRVAATAFAGPVEEETTIMQTPEHDGGAGMAADEFPRDGSGEGIEWGDDMVAVNRLTTTAESGLEGHGVLVRTGQVVDLLFDVTNPGLWMAHCHIAEHMQSGMMFSFNVIREGGIR